MNIRETVLLAGIWMIAVFAGAEEKTVKVLAVGNSFSRNALHWFSDIVEASGNKTVAVNAMIAGCDFERHMRHADAFDANPADPEGRPYRGKKSLRDLLTQEKWDYVTIQQASPKSFRPETFHPHADRLIAYIRNYAPQAEIVIHQTWAYREDHPFWGQTNLNTDVMYKGLRAAYDGLAKETGFRQIPSGDAMEAARRDPAWGKFIPDASVDPQTSEVKNEKRSLHNKDAYHANVKGEYLLGCVWFEFFFGRSVIGNSFLPDGVTADEAAVLQCIAHRTVSERQRPEPAQ